MTNDKIEIIPLPKEQWKGTPIPLVTKTDSYYDLEISPLDKDGCKINLIKKPFEKQVVHSPEEYDFPDGLYQDHWENADAYGVVGNPELIQEILSLVTFSAKAESLSVDSNVRHDFLSPLYL